MKKLTSPNPGSPAPYVMSLDFGLSSIGIAVGSFEADHVQPITAIRAVAGRPRSWDPLARLLALWKPAYLVVGLPLNMDGSAQPLTQRARKFAVILSQIFGITVKLQDERLSTVEARAKLFAQGGYRALTKAKIDAVSAAIILEDFFKEQRRQEEALEESRVDEGAEEGPASPC